MICAVKEGMEAYVRVKKDRSDEEIKENEVCGCARWHTGLGIDPRAPPTPGNGWGSGRRTTGQCQSFGMRPYLYQMLSVNSLTWPWNTCSTTAAVGPC